MKFSQGNNYQMIIIALLILILGLLGGKYLFSSEQPEETQVANEEETRDRIPVHVANISRKSITEYNDYNAVLKAEKEYYVFPQLSDEVEEIKVKEGEEVKKGDLLFELEGEQVKKQRKEAEAGLKQAQSQLDQVERGAREEEIKQSESRVKQAEESLAGARETYELIKGEKEDMISYREQVLNAENQLDNARAQKKMSEKELENARISLKEARDNFERMEFLYQEGALPEQEFASIKYQKQQAETNVELAKEQDEQAQKNLENAQKGLELAEESFEKPRSLDQQLANAKNQVEIAKTNLDQARAQHDLLVAGASEEEIKGAQARLEQAQAGLDIAKDQEEKLKVTSPGAGIVNSIEIEEGSLVTPQASSPPVTVISSNLQVELTVNEETIVHLSEGQEVELEIPVINNHLSGKITDVSVSRSEEAGGFPLEIKINELTDEVKDRLKPGMYAAVELPQKEAQDVPVVPREAVLREGTNYYLYIIENKEQQVERVQVELGISDENVYEISSGISENTEVVIEGQNMLEDGDYIEVMSSEDF